MHRPKLLVLNACDTPEGDVNMLLLALANFPPDAFEVYAASVPRGQVAGLLRERVGDRFIPVEMGGAEARPSGAEGRAWRAHALAGAIATLVTRVRRERIDALYAIDRTVAPIVAAAVARLTGRPFILSAHYPFYPTGGRAARFAIRQAARIHVDTHFLRAHYPPAVADPSRVVVIPCAIQIERYDPSIDATAARAELGVPAGVPLVAMAGRLSPYKGQDALIEATPRVLAAHPDACVLIAGHDTTDAMHTHGPSATRFAPILSDMIRTRDLDERVRLVGYVPSLPRFYAAATLAAMPSWEEPFGLVALEAMAMARPVVATRAGGVPEFITDGEVGLLIPPRDPTALADAILRLLADPARAAAMGRAGRARVEACYSASPYAEAVARLIYTTLGRRWDAGR